MKAHIMTFINLYNYGSVLQAYALNKFLRQSGIETDTIYYDLAGGQKVKLITKIKIFVTRMFYLFPMLSKEKKFKNFIQNYVPLAGDGKVFTNAEELDKFGWDVNDLFIVGSDQCWCELNRKEFFLNFCAGKKIAYAVSMGDRLLNPKEIEIIQEDTKFFSAVSLREKYHQEQFGCNFTACIDPVFLLQPEEWCELVEPINTKMVKNDYIFVYTIYGSPIMDEYLSEMREKTGMDIVVVGGMRKKTRVKGVKFLRNIGIEEWLSFIQNSSVVVTDSFHATAFSIIFKKKVVPFSKGSFTRIDNLLNTFSVQNGSIHYSKPEAMEEYDYNEIGRKMRDPEGIVCKSKKWLFDQLGLHQES